MELLRPQPPLDALYHEISQWEVADNDVAPLADTEPRTHEVGLDLDDLEPDW